MGEMMPLDDEFEFTFVRSSGPGGQNVNKVNSKAVLRWAVGLTRNYTPEQITLLLAKLPVTKDGDCLITSDRYRDQAKNREDCIQKLLALVQAALKKAKPRKKTKKSYSSRIKAKESKKRHSEKKSMRRYSG